MNKLLIRGSWRDAVWLFVVPVPFMLLSGYIGNILIAVLVCVPFAFAYMLALAKFVAWTLNASIDRYLMDRFMEKLIGGSHPGSG